MSNPKNPEIFTESHLATLRQEYASIETCSVEMLPKFHAMFARMTDSQLIQIAKAQIKFVSKLAINAAIRRNLQLA